eukprot:14011388-Alexandrium_andersonii.AAC.1
MLNAAALLEQKKGTTRAPTHGGRGRVERDYLEAQRAHRWAGQRLAEGETRLRRAIAAAQRHHRWTANPPRSRHDRRRMAQERDWLRETAVSAGLVLGACLLYTSPSPRD